jgi:enamine deaminase RidA (YjgF/YER057c/UK114 family)
MDSSMTRTLSRSPASVRSSLPARICGASAVAILLAVTAAPAQAPQPMPGVRFINPPTIGQPRGYTHVVETAGLGRTVYIAGQLGYDVSGKVPEPGDFRAQAAQVFENLKAALASVGGGSSTWSSSTRS